MISAQRCELQATETAKLMGDLSPQTHHYCVIYEMDGDPDEVMGVITEKVMSGEMHMNDALDLTTAQMAWWKPVGELQVSPGK
jgi:hypothetical protein